MKAFITSSGVISPQQTFDSFSFPSTINETVSDRLICIEPDYRGLINPIYLRRMPRILKMGLAASQICIQRSGNINPDAIIVGTGLGCLDNLEKFLMEVIDSDEHIKSVLPFINSTHNAVAAQIAMMLKNHNYNITYCHRGFSFESALLDSLMLIEEKQAETVLVGGIDECTSDFVHLHSYLGYWKKPLNNLHLLREHTTGTIAGEGSAFFMMSADSRNNSRVMISGVHSFFTPEGAQPGEIEAELDQFLQDTYCNKNDLGLAILGINGDADFDTSYYTLQQNYFDSHTCIAFYKHLCGEYYTSSSFALWLGKEILEYGIIPEVIRLTHNAIQPIRKLLIYNHIRNTEHNFILMMNG
jgi:3-oxoacyl-[acyl-carrier-protein] synthase II